MTFERNPSLTTARGWLVAALIVLAAPAGGCQDDGPSAPAGGGADAGAGAANPLYVVSTNIQTTGDQWTTLIGTIDSLEPGVREPANAIERPDFAGVVASPLVPGAFFVSEGERLTRFEIDPGGAFAEKAKMSFAAFGVSWLGMFVIASPEKAYAVDTDGAQIMVWNPATMTASAPLSLAPAVRQGFTIIYPLSAVVRDGKVYFVLSWLNRKEGRAVPASMLVALDSATDQVTLVEEPRCGGLRNLFETSGGDIYASGTDNFFAIHRRLYGEQAGTLPCLVRLKKGEARFDPGFLLKATDLTSAEIAGDFWAVGAGANERILFNAFDTAIKPITPTTAYAEVGGAQAWRRMSVPVAVLDGKPAQAEPVALLGAGARYGYAPERVNGRSFVVVPTTDYSRSPLWDVTDPKAPREGPTFRGSFGRLIRMR